MDANERPWNDAETLFARGRYANADHLYGAAAECGLKRLMVSFGTAVNTTGSPADSKDRTHANIIWVRFEGYRSGKVEGAGFGLPTANPFDNWDVSDRYAHQSNFSLATVQIHQAGAAVICERIRKAQHMKGGMKMHLDALANLAKHCGPRHFPGRSAFQIAVKVLMRTQAQQNNLFWLEFAWLRPASQQYLLFVELELVDEYSSQVAFLFFAARWVRRNGGNGCIDDLFVAHMQFFHNPAKRWRVENFQSHCSVRGVAGTESHWLVWKFLYAMRQSPADAAMASGKQTLSSRYFAGA